MHGSMVWGGWSEVWDACIAAWLGVNGQRWEMHVWHHGLGSMVRGVGCMHSSMVWCGWADVRDACIAAGLGVDGHRWELHS